MNEGQVKSKPVRTVQRNGSDPAAVDAVMGSL